MNPLALRLTAGPDSSASFSPLMMAVAVPENTVLPPHNSTCKEPNH